MWAMASLSNSTADINAGKLVLETAGFTSATGVFMSDFISGAPDASNTNNDFYWLSIGF